MKMEKAMKYKILTKISLSIFCLIIFTVNVKAEIISNINVKNGMELFDGSKSFENGGPACISCHNITNNNLIPGGILAKDLTNVYQRMGEGITGWLSAPPFPAMASSYQNNPLTEIEKASLTAFFKYADEVSNEQQINTGYTYQLVGGGIGLLCLLIIINFLWFKRKKQMVKQDIFNRQIKAHDAKF